jgi:hypothetical protein
MDFSTLTAILRTIIYVWVGIEFANLAYLYWYGYEKLKPTPIISALQIMCTVLSILFFIFAFLPIFLDLDPDTHANIVSFLPLITIPLALAVRRFRSESLQKQSMPLPKEKKKE